MKLTISNISQELLLEIFRNIHNKYPSQAYFYPKIEKDMTYLLDELMVYTSKNIVHPIIFDLAQYETILYKLHSFKRVKETALIKGDIVQPKEEQLLTLNEKILILKSTFEIHDLIKVGKRKLSFSEVKPSPKNYLIYNKENIKINEVSTQVITILKFIQNKVVTVDNIISYLTKENVKVDKTYLLKFIRKFHEMDIIKLLGEE